MVLLATLLTAAAAGFGPSLEGFPLVPSGVGPVDSADSAAKGGCSGQYLRDGVQLPDLPLFYERVTPGAAWGTPEMVELLVETSRHMRWLMPEASKIVIGDISHRNGGVLEGHKSHRGGVDADVGIFRTGGWQSSRGFTDLYPDEFDVEANWALISAMLETGLVDMILLDRGHINRLMAYTLRTGLLTPSEIDRIFPGDSKNSWGMTGIVRHVPGHTGHLHVRVLCGDGSKAE